MSGGKRAADTVARSYFLALADRWHRLVLRRSRPSAALTRAACATCASSRTLIAYRTLRHVTFPLPSTPAETRVHRNVAEDAGHRPEADWRGPRLGAILGDAHREDLDDVHSAAGGRNQSGSGAGLGAVAMVGDDASGRHRL
jgi:hypothetical protein